MTLLQMSVSGAVMILVILLMRLFFIHKLPKRAFALLWEIALLRLLLPVSISSALSIYSLLGRNTPVQNTMMQGMPENAAVEPGAGQFIADSGVTGGIRGGSPMVSGWTVVWLVGMVLCAAFFLVSYVHWYRKFRTSVPVGNAFAAEWLKKHPLKRSVRIRQSGEISAPLTYGILRPVILMPKDTDWDHRRQANHVLLHEYMHIRYYDMVFKLLASFVLCIHWLNPTVWLLYALFNRDLELACDESVVRRLGDGAKAAYAGTLIMMEERKSGLMPMCSHFSKNSTEERIEAIMRSKKITIGAVAVSLAALAAIVILFATSPVVKTGQGSLPAEGSEIDLLNQLTNSIVFSGDSINFTIPEGDHDWHIQVNGREELEGFGGMSVHYLQERTEADDWKSGETYSFPVDAAVCTELYMEVSIDDEGETAAIDLTDYISMIPYVF